AQEGSKPQGLAVGAALVAGVLTKAPGVLLFGIPLAVGIFLRPNRPGWRALAGAYVVGIPPAAYALWRFLATRNAERMVDIATENPSGPILRLFGNLGEAAGWLWA